MTIITSTNQAECVALLIAAGALEHLVPTKGKDCCYGISHAGERDWLVSSNDNGIYVVHFVADASQAEVMDFMKGLAGPGGVTNARIEITNGKPEMN